MNSEYSCAASVLFGAMTSAGRSTAAMTEAIVYVFPDPVTPSRTCRARPWASPSESSRIAPGWSPAGRERRGQLERGAHTQRLHSDAGSLLVFPRGAGLAVLEEDARRLELLADPVGLGVLLRRPRGPARLDPREDLPFRHSSRRAPAPWKCSAEGGPQQAEDGEQRVEQRVPREEPPRLLPLRRRLRRGEPVQRADRVEEAPQRGGGVEVVVHRLGEPRRRVAQRVELLPFRHGGRASRRRPGTPSAFSLTR